ncbi:serine/arginine repetitive matrix protein 2-like isoform X1 [Actinia tenebrosa]|uniref:Serine/arginine repetitive matrix protein 2-like isoform X1 n=1 Tax=Actinia tenebrosa TaxID=6105 RepID=A0A6P8ISC6_ACTTE|nr:serine/arginine repetitive matrix protein 2-like isoform X1 [Actinia tenebrosa]
MADEAVRVTSNKTCETATKTIEALRLFNERSMHDSPNVDDDDSKSDEIEREKTASPSLEIAEECIESFIHQGLENVDNEHEEPASTLSDTYNRHHLEVSKPLSIDGYKEGSFDRNPKLQENILNTEASHDSERHNFKEQTTNIIMEVKNIINTCLLDAANLDDSLSINADDDAIDNSEKELNEVKKEIDLEENSKERFGETSTLNTEHYDRTYSKSKMNDSVKSDIEDTESFLKKGDNVATDDDGINRNEVDATKDGKKDKKKHKKHSKKKKKKHKKEKKAEKQKGKDSKVSEEKGAKGDDENSLEDQVFEMDTDVPSSSSKYLTIVKDSLESKPHQKRKIASIVTCVSSANANTLSDKGEPGFKEEPISQKHKETSKVDHSTIQSSERSSKSNESIKDEVKSNVSTLSSKGEQGTKDDSTSQRYWETSQIDKSKRRSSERSSKSNEVKEGELHRQLSSASTSAEAKDQVKRDNTSYHSDKSFGEKHKKSKKKRRHRSREEESRESPQSVGRFSKSSTQSEEYKEKEEKKKSESSERDVRKLSRHHSHESSRTSSHSEHQKSRISRSGSRESEEFQTSEIRQRPRSKSKDRRSRKHGKRSRSKSKHRRSRSRSVDKSSKDRRESGRTSMGVQTKEDHLSRSRSVDKTSKNRYRSKSKSSDGSNDEIKEKRPRIRGRSRSRSMEKGERRKRDSQRSRKKSNAPTKKRALSRSISRERSPRDQKSPSRKHASKERSPIRVESNAPPKKRALSRSTSRERSPKKRSQTSTEVLSDYNTNSNEDSTSILNTVRSFATSMVEKQSSKERLVQGTNKTIDNTDSLKEGKEEVKDEEHVNRISKDGNSGKVVTKEDSEDERKQFEANETSENVRTSKNSNRPDEKEILADTSEGIKTIEDALDLEREKNLESSASLDTKPCIEKANVEPEDQHDAKGIDVYNKTVGSDQAMDTTSGSISHQDVASVMNNERSNQNSAANMNIQIPPPPPHLLTQNELANSNLPRGPPHNKGNLVCPPVVNPFVRTFPDQGTTMNSAPINQQPQSVQQCPAPLNMFGPQPQSANQIALDQSHTVFTENVVPQGFALGPNQEPLKDNTSAPSPYIQQSSLLGLPTSASVIPFLDDEGPKILPEEKEKPSNIWVKTDAVDTNHAQALVPSPVDMDMSSPEEDIIEKMNEEFWENERKGTKEDDNSVRKEKSLESQYDTCTQVQDEREEYDPEHFVSNTSPKQKKKKDKTKKHSDSKTKVQSLIDKLHRQARVEDEVKIVLKDYYKHREINKNEYKDILRKAVPQVANSDHSIDPERIRSLVKKYVAKMKGQRHLKPKS